MSAEESLYSALSNDAPVTALVSARIYPDAIPLDKGLPGIAYRRVGTDPVTTLHGGAPIAETATLEIACLDDTRAGAEAVADAVVAAAAAGGFYLVDRGWDEDPDNNLFDTVLTVEKFSNL